MGYEVIDFHEIGGRWNAAMHYLQLRRLSGTFIIADFWYKLIKTSQSLMGQCTNIILTNG